MCKDNYEVNNICVIILLLSNERIEARQILR